MTESGWKVRAYDPAQLPLSKTLIRIFQRPLSAAEVMAESELVLSPI